MCSFFGQQPASSHPHVLVSENVTIGACTVSETSSKLPWVPLRKSTHCLRSLKTLLRFTAANIDEKLLCLGRRFYKHVV